MNYFEKLKSQMIDMNRIRGFKREILVDYDSLYQLIDEHEKLDSFYRIQYNYHCSDLITKLHDILHAMYYENHDSEILMLTIIQILKPMIEERLKRREVYQIFRKE